MGGMFGGGQKQQAQAPIPAQKVIPVEDTTVTDMAKKRSQAAAQQRGGVASTVLSDMLGG
ncbi:MAG TPA: hypothetical protein VIM16_05910 [Mucilaginibacter sp.]|jgi:hypothetical protein